MSDKSLILYDQTARSLTFAEEAEAAKLAALNGTALIGSVNNPAQQQAAVNAVKDVKSILLAVERARKAIKEPLLEACRLIDARAAEFVAELKDEEIRVNTSLGNYQQEIIINARREEAKRQEALRKIEEERQAEARRIAAEAAEAERVRAEAERKAAAEAEAERQRIAAAANAAKSKLEKARLEKERLALEARMKAEAEAREAQRIKDEAAAKAEAERQDALAKQAVEAVGPAAPMQKARGQVVKAVWTFEITDIWLLARTNPGLVRIEPNTSEINQVIALGARDIKGMRIFEVVKSSTRQSGQTVINI
jgi:hypothetical protein